MRNPNIEGKLDLPPKNTLLPKETDAPLNGLFTIDEEPKLVKKWNDTDLWVKKDTSTPQSIVSFQLFTNDLDLGNTPQSIVFQNFWKEMLSEYMSELNYMAYSANLQFSVTPFYNGMHFQWIGFNSSIPLYVNKTLQKLV